MFAYPLGRRCRAPGSLALAATVQVLACLPASGASASAPDSLPALDPMVVVGSRLSRGASESNRSIAVIDRGMIDAAPASNVADLLEYVAGVDVRQRGVDGVQSDLQLRGGTFEQALVMIDGIPVSDPQTGHHNMDLPIGLADIERIEVLRGQGSTLYGPNAFSGAVNIVTRRTQQSGLSLRFEGGQFGALSASGGLSFARGPATHRLSGGKSVSAGYRQDTEYNNSTASYSGSLLTGKTAQRVLLGFVDKPFGANSFYLANNPKEWEHTRTFVGGSSGETSVGRLRLSNRLYWRHHNDTWVPNRETGAGSREHTSDSYGAEAQMSVPWRVGESVSGEAAVGVLGQQDRIASKSLGDHSRYQVGLFGEQSVTLLKRLTLVPGFLLGYYSRWGVRFWPSLNVGIGIVRGLKVFGSAGTSFRVPSYTECYFNYPGKYVANPDLRPETALTYEAGIRWQHRAAFASCAGFRSKGEGLIDWVSRSDGAAWKSNALTLTTDGLELESGFLPQGFWKRSPVSRVSAGYAYLRSDGDGKNGATSKYVLNHIRHQVIGDVTLKPLAWLENTWRMKYEQRVHQDGFVLVDAKVQARVWNAWVYADVTNLLGAEYTDGLAIPMPGRWFRAGIRMDLAVGR